MRYLLARLHRDHILALMDRCGGALPVVRLTVNCPTCGMRYVADPPEGEEDIPLMRDERIAALARLEGECPDHAGWFAVK